MAADPYDPHPPKVRRERFDPEFVAVLRIIAVSTILATLLYLLNTLI